jgi:hypothetical protein
MLFYYDKRIFVSVLTIILFNIFLINLPLTSVFGYEFSAINSVLLVIISGLLIISFLNRQENYLRNIFKISPVFLIIPLIISIFNSLVGTTCSIVDGLLFYVVITIPAILIGSALGLFAFYLSNLLPRTIFLILLVIIAFIPVFEIYYNPQIYFYNPLIGFFPGTIYDERLDITLKLIVYRLINVGFFISLFYSVFQLQKQSRWIIKYLFLLLISCVVILFLLYSSYLGYSTNKSKIESSLKGKCYTEHFEIIYDTSVDSTFLKNVIINHEYYYFELKKFFMDEPHRKITSFIFKNDRQKGELFGSENADVAKPWLYQIYTTAVNYDNTLKHEIAHIFSASFGTGPFKIAHNFNPALIEGIAEAASPLYNNWYIDQIASIAYNNNYKYPVDKLYSGFNFFGQSSGLSYVYAGSFTNYLINRYGIEKFKEWYKGKPFSDIYGLDLSHMSSKYYEYLQQLGYSDKQSTAQYCFGRQTIFSKFCPRYIGHLLEIGWSKFNKNNFTEAEKDFDYINKITDNYSALFGLVLSEVELKKEKEALLLIDKNISKYRSGSYYYGLELLRGDLLIRNNQYEYARLQYNQINSQNPDLRYNYLSKLRINLSRNDSLIYRYVTGVDSVKYQLLINDNLIDYDYSSFPVILDLAVSLNKPYKDVISVLNGDVIVDDIYSCFAAYYMSKYMMENLDLAGARKFAALALYYNNEDGMRIFLRSHLLRTEWIYYNHARILDNAKYVTDRTD